MLLSDIDNMNEKFTSDDSNCAWADGLASLWDDVNRHGYALTTDQALGLPPEFTPNFREAYFNGHYLRHDEGDLPRDRERARDVILYEWDDDGLHVEEYETIVITDRSGIKGPRLHNRIEILADRGARDLVERLLALVPPNRRQTKGTFGVNFFRTFNDVVTKPHRDEEEFIIIYVLHRDGDGAETYLYQDDLGADEQEYLSPVLKHQLNRGDLIIFEDKAFLHEATPLISPPSGKSMRDALVCSVDYRTTYLDAVRLEPPQHHA
jgi:hypothetical protein